MGTNLVTEIISILVSGISGIATGIGTGLGDLVSSIFLVSAEGGGTALSTFGTVIIVFAAISLAIGLCRWVMSFITSLGSFH